MICMAHTTATFIHTCRQVHIHRLCLCYQEGSYRNEHVGGDVSATGACREGERTGKGTEWKGREGDKDTAHRTE